MLSVSACGHSTSGGGSTTTSDQSQSDQSTKSTNTNKSSKSNNSATSNSSTSNNSATNQSQSNKTTSESGTNNIKNVKGFVQNNSQSFTVNLKAWGTVKFVSGKITGGAHIPTVFYLTNNNGDILYSFNDSPFPYNVDVKAVSFQDVNKDGLKDIIIIVSDKDNSGKPIAAIWLQNANKTFTCDNKLTQAMNNSGNNGDIKTATDYLSKQF